MEFEKLILKVMWNFIENTTVHKRAMIYEMSTYMSVSENKFTINLH